jgi:molybdopterin synthase sulfur carrier subunit
MMRIQVRFFASLRDALGTDVLELVLAEGTLGCLRSALDDQLGAVASLLWANNVRLAHNHTLVSAPAALQLAQGDELAFLPPVTGG